MYKRQDKIIEEFKECHRTNVGLSQVAMDQQQNMREKWAQLRSASVDLAAFAPLSEDTRQAYIEATKFFSFAMPGRHSSGAALEV